MAKIKSLEDPKGKPDPDLQEILLSLIHPLPDIPTSMVCMNCCKYGDKCDSNGGKDSPTWHLKFWSDSLWKTAAVI